MTKEILIRFLPDSKDSNEEFRVDIVNTLWELIARFTYDQSLISSDDVEVIKILLEVIRFGKLETKLRSMDLTNEIEDMLILINLLKHIDIILVQQDVNNFKGNMDLIVAETTDIMHIRLNPKHTYTTISSGLKLLTSFSSCSKFEYEVSTDFFMVMNA